LIIRVAAGFWATVDDVLPAINNIHDQNQTPQKLISKIIKNR
jgi:hypothetical protein